MVADEPMENGQETRTVDDVEQEVQEIVVIVEDLKRQLKHSRDLNQALEEELESVRVRHQDAEAVAVARMEEIGRLRKEIGQLQQENDQLMTEMGALNEERGEAVNEIHKLMNDRDGLRDEMQSQQDAHKRRENDLGIANRKAAAQEQALRATIHEMEETLNHAQDVAEKRIAELSQANQQIEELTLERDSLKERMAQFERSRENIRRIRASLNGALDPVP